MPTGSNATLQGTPNQPLLDQTRRQMYASTLEDCRTEIMEAIRRGDHAEAWEIICDGPERAGWQRPQPVTLQSGKVINVCLRHGDTASMRDELRDYAKLNGWDEDKGRERVVGMMRQSQAARHKVQSAWNARPGRVTG